MAEDRRYDDREVGLILKRVAELHEREGDKHDARAMTKVEIEHVVTELGISKALVSRAVSDVAMQDLRNRPVWWLGGKTDLMFEDTVDGPVDDETLEQMLETLRRHLGEPGELKHEGSARIWSTKQSTRRIFLSVVQHRDHTTVRLEERMPVDARVTVGMGALAGGFTGLMLAVPLKVVLLKAVMLLALGPTIAVTALLGWAIGRTFWKRRSAAREDQLHRAFGEVMRLAASTPAPALSAVDEDD